MAEALGETNNKEPITKLNASAKKQTSRFILDLLNEWFVGERQVLRILHLTAERLKARAIASTHCVAVGSRPLIYQYEHQSSPIQSWSCSESGGVRIRALLVTASNAREWEADLIVVAAPKSRRLDAIVGTTAERLVRTAKRPVLVVRRDVQGGYRDVAIATDLSSASLPLIRTAVRLGALEGAAATVVHAVHPSYDGMMKSVGPR